jgi:hypothetical protein
MYNGKLDVITSKTMSKNQKPRVFGQSQVKNEPREVSRSDQKNRVYSDVCQMSAASENASKHAPL